MTSAQSSAPSSASPRGAGGVIHIRTRQTSHFTVLANRLAQRAGSAITVGVAAYVLSLPDGAPITIGALCTHFTEGKIAIARALRELEAEGWLERRVERGPHGRIVTRTFAYDLPGASPAPAGSPEPVPDPEPGTADDAPAPTAPQAVALLAALPERDRRLLLSEREIGALAPAVTEWLDRGGFPAGDHRRAHRQPPRTPHPPPGPPARPSPGRPAATGPYGPPAGGGARPAHGRPAPELRRLRPRLPEPLPRPLPRLAQRLGHSTKSRLKGRHLAPSPPSLPALNVVT
ncbi:hypothetical protein ACIQNI_04415 [Streptomyces sp. NPDC091266]|uniref:hypothetical protein n=1 Tax=Streptomyces sp. NPDC091266 TaxID=3365978 RepID=UPI0037F734CF